MKFRLFSLLTVMLGLNLVVVLSADEAGKGGKKAIEIRDDAALQEQILARQFKEFQEQVLKLKQRLERSPRPEDKERAAVLEKVLERAQDASITTQFEKIVDVLKTQKFSSVTEIKEAAERTKKLADDLRDLVALLREDSRSKKLRDEQEILKNLIKDIEKTIFKQKVNQGLTDLNKTDKNELKANQKQVTQDIAKIAKAMEGKSGQGGEAKNMKGDAKDGGKEGGKKGGESKDVGKLPGGKKAEAKDQGGKSPEGKTGEAKGGEGKSGEKSPPKSGEGEAKSGKGAEAKQGGAKGSKGSEGAQGSPKESKGGEAKQGEPKEGGSKDAGKEAGVKQKQGEAKAGEKSQPKKDGEGKQAEAKSGKGSEGKEAKSGKSGDSKPGDSKSGGDPKQGEAKSGPKSQGQAKSSGGGQSPPQQSPPQASNKGDNQPPPPSGNKTPQDNPITGKKQVEDAKYPSQQAEEKIGEGKNKEASKEEGDVIKKLEDAKKKLEDLLRQLREEELERLLAQLQARCEKMLAMQIEVLGGTEQVAKAINLNENKKPGRENVQESLRQADKEKEIVTEATKAMELLEAEGSAVAFPEVFQQVREDMKHVQRRLEMTDAGPVTQAIEKDIIDTLKEMIEALKKARQEMDNKKSPPSDGKAGPPPDQKLLDQIAELKMIRSMQLRVNARTQVYGKMYQGEQAGEPNIRREIIGLSERQERIFDITNRIAKGDNK